MAYLDKDGYLIIMIKGKKVRQHRFIMENHLGRKLGTKEHVHHRNGNKVDNRQRIQRIRTGHTLVIRTL